jgi:hypothetical protein
MSMSVNHSCLNEKACVVSGFTQLLKFKTKKSRQVKSACLKQSMQPAELSCCASCLHFSVMADGDDELRRKPGFEMSQRF